MGATYWAARVRVEIARALLDSNQEGAAAMLDSAVPVLVTAGAVRALAELTAIRDALAVVSPS